MLCSAHQRRENAVESGAQSMTVSFRRNASAHSIAPAKKAREEQKGMPSASFGTRAADWAQMCFLALCKGSGWGCLFVQDGREVRHAAAVLDCGAPCSSCSRVRRLGAGPACGLAEHGIPSCAPIAAPAIITSAVLVAVLWCSCKRSTRDDSCLLAGTARGIVRIGH